MIKGNKHGINLVLDSEPDFRELRKEVAVKFSKSAGFFDKRHAVAITFSGRDLSEEEMRLLVETIQGNGGPEISCIINDEIGDLLAATAENHALPVEDFAKDRLTQDGQFYKGTLRSGQKLEVDGSIIILGDVNPGAMVIARGNIVIIGCLKGNVYAGYPDDKNALISALLMEPMQIQIGPLMARAADDSTSAKKPMKKKTTVPLEATMAYVENDQIIAETITRELIAKLENHC